MASKYWIGYEAARQINRAIRATNDIPRPSARAHHRRPHSSTISSAVPVYNASGETVPSGGLMAISGTTMIGGVTFMSITKPTSTFERLVLISGAGTIAVADTGVGYMADLPFPAMYDSTDGTPAQGQCWGPYPSSWKMRRHMYGMYIWGEVDQDAKKALVTQVMVPNVIGKTDAAITKGSTGTVSVWKGDQSADATVNIENVKNPFADVEITKWVRVVWDAETPCLAAAECE
jgi:hypothetical protein